MSRQEDFIEAGIQYRFEHGKPMAIGGDNFAEMANEMNRCKGYEAGAEYGYQYAQTHPNWISVEDELPPPHYEGANSTDFVLVYDGFDLEFGYYDFGQKNWHGEDFKEMMFDVTHWMPLPQPPRKEDKK